ncbi:response regulator [Azohydromonas lata]|uniref:Response regulator n=1 Tax=Azohydromonas lata TaxID=45677 RepID=A0ABU5IQB6_9BURK|nr:response regulator [Azohydromonas lata]MDZ5461096.1 response regulator [Azohydromonas lata]
MSPLRILVVDDELSNAEVLALILHEEGFQVTVAGDGRQALERIDEAAPELLITDYMMPGMNGMELARAVRQLPQYRNVPVLLMSGAAASTLSTHAKSFDAFLRKPFDIEALLKAVELLLARPPAQ